MKNIAILCNSYPCPGGKAESTFMGYLSKYILEKKYSLDFYHLDHSGDLNKKLINKKYNFLNNKKFKLSKIKIKKKTGIFANKFIKLLLVFPVIDNSFRFDLENISFDKKKYDLVITMDHSAYHLSNKLNFKKRLFITGDPPGERNYIFNRINFQKPFLKGLLLLVYSFVCFKFENYYWKWIINLSTTKVAVSGTLHSVRMKKDLNLSSILDLRPPTPIFKSKKYFISKNHTNIVLGGSLGGSFAKSTISNFLNLVKLTKNYDFKFYLIGHDIDRSFEGLNNLIKSKNIKILESVKKFESTLSRMNIFILPTDYYIGVRTRICSALSAGNYCIISKAVLINMPELKNCKSIQIVNNDNSEIIASLKKYHNYSLKKKKILIKEAKNFFKKNYFYPVTSRKILSIL